MTDITIEQRAQLAYETWRDTPADGDSAWPKWLAVAEALRLSAGADWNDAIEAAALEGDHWQLRSGSSHKCGEYIAGAIRTLKRPAAPRHETGEG